MRRSSRAAGFCSSLSPWSCCEHAKLKSKRAQADLCNIRELPGSTASPSCLERMAKYVFSVDDGRAPTETYDYDLEDLGAARVEAARLFGSLIAHEPKQFWSTMDFVVTVAKEDGLVLFQLRALATEAPCIPAPCTPLPSRSPDVLRRPCASATTSTPIT